MGILPAQYWELTFSEINEIAKAHNDMVKDQVSYNYMQARLVAQFVGLSMAGKQLPSLFELYPDLYSEEHRQADEKKQMMWLREQMLVFADNRNALMGGTNG